MLKDFWRLEFCGGFKLFLNIAPLSLLLLGIRMLGGDVTDIVEAQSLSFRPHYIDIYLAGWGPEDDGATLEGPGPLTRLALKSGIQTVRLGQGDEKPCWSCLFLSVSYLQSYIFFISFLFFFLLSLCVKILIGYSSFSASQINFRAGGRGDLFLFGHRGMEGEKVTTAPVMATATAFTPSLSAAAVAMEAGQITWRDAPPHWLQLTVVGRQRRW